jgi:hypothetical protein
MGRENKNKHEATPQIQQSLFAKITIDLIEKQMRCEYSMMFGTMIRSNAVCFSQAVKMLTVATMVLGACSYSLVADDVSIPKFAATPEIGVPPSPNLAPAISMLHDATPASTAMDNPVRGYSSPGNLRFREVPLREVPSNDSQTSVAKSDSSELPSEPAKIDIESTSDVRAATTNNERPWQVQQDNPLRKTTRATTALPAQPPAQQLTSKDNTAQVSQPKISEPNTKQALTSDTDMGLAPTKSVEPKPLEKSTDENRKPSQPTAAVPWTDAQLVVPSQEKSERDAESHEVELKWNDTQEESPPPTADSPSETEKPPVKKDFDPEDNDQPAQAESLKISDSGTELENPIEPENEPHASELLKLMLDQPSLAPNDSSADNSSESAATENNSGKPSTSNERPTGPSSRGRTTNPAAKSPEIPLQPKKVSQAALRLRPRIDAAMNYYLLRPETNVERSPWAVMHAILPYGAETTLRADGRTVSAIGWMSFNGSCRGQRMFIPLKDGSFKPAVGAGLQGHDGQFLAILAQSRVVANYPLQVGRKRYTIENLIDYEMRTCQAKTELTFKLIALSHYLENDATWTNDQGEAWNLERLVEEELSQPIIGAACGGTHRLMGLSYALKQRRIAGLPIDGQYARAEIFLKDFVDYAWTLQNPDGSFSTEWFEGRGNKSDLQRKLQTTGHIVEWLVFQLSDEELQSPRMLRALEFLTNCLVEQRQTDWKIGPRSHALHALALYQERVFGVRPGTRRNMAAAASRTKRW